MTGQSGAPDQETGGDRTVRGARPGDRGRQDSQGRQTRRLGVTGQSGAPDHETGGDRTVRGARP